MKLNVFFTLILIITYGQSFGQPAAISEIRRIYQHISNNEASYYQNIIKHNTANQDWPGTGTYQKEVRFYYADSPLSCDECGENGEFVLEKVVVTEKYDLSSYYTEFIYDRGKLIFCYKRTENEQTDEQRFYFSQDQLIRYINNGEILDGTAVSQISDKQIRQKALEVQKLFLVSF